MCNLYTQTTAQEAMRRLFEAEDRLGNLPPLIEVYPDYSTPIVRAAGAGRELVRARWGMPTPPQYLLGKRVDRGVTNVRNVASPHWRQWLTPAQRCLVPFDRFAEPAAGGSTAWFELTDGRPAAFAGIWTRWTSVRKLKDGETTDDLFAFLTCAPNAEVAAVHPRAMPVILTEPADWQAWLTDPLALRLQRPLPDGSLRNLGGEQLAFL